MKLSPPPRGWKAGWLRWRNRVLRSAEFQRRAAALPLSQWVARRRAARLFDLVAGFVHSQVLAATVECGLLERLGGAPCHQDVLAGELDLTPDATLRLLRAASSIAITQEITPGWWTLGQDGAALSGNPGAQAMIRHHRLLYADLADPLALLRADRACTTHLSRFWTYAAREAGDATPYSELMAASQAMVAEQVTAAYPFARHRALLDVGGGHGVFVRAVRRVAPGLRLGLFDLPEVITGARRLFEPGFAPQLHPGSFFVDALPTGYDLISLVRVLHDHDDRPTHEILAAARAALRPGGRILVAEPMAATRGAEAMGDGYFGLYLWAMRSGRPRTAREIAAMLREAGFRRPREIRTALPLIARVIVADG